MCQSVTQWEAVEHVCHKGMLIELFLVLSSPRWGSVPPWGKWLFRGWTIWHCIRLRSSLSPTSWGANTLRLMCLATEISPTLTLHPPSLQEFTTSKLPTLGILRIVFLHCCYCHFVKKRTNSDFSLDVFLYIVLQ